MSVTLIKTYTNIGLKWYEITIEADLNKSLPGIEIIGLPDASIKESKERIRAAFRNCWISLPPQKIIINLAPSDIKKIGTRFDLPIAVAIFLSMGEWSTTVLDIEKTLFFGELWLDGVVKGVQGVLPSVLAAVDAGYTTFVVPEDNANEISCIPGICIYRLTNFLQLVHFFQGMSILDFTEWMREKEVFTVLDNVDSQTFDDIKGHATVKRALTIAAAGMHNVLLVWPPGSGKTLLAKATQTLLPPLLFSEALEISKIYSVAGVLHAKQPLVVQRPFRAIHHTASKISIIGWWQYLSPGEVSLAHKGILFFDELPEFPREVLEVLRQPLEEKVVTISRANGSVDYPADFMFIAAMNPCKCGYYRDTEKACSCSYNDVKKYQSKISWPLLDRFDMIIEVPRQKADIVLTGTTGDTYTLYRAAILKAWEKQSHRYAGSTATMNARLTSKGIEQFIPLDVEVKKFLTQASSSLTLSSRVLHRLIKVARTIADIEQSEHVTIAHVAEWLQYRSKTMFLE